VAKHASLRRECLQRMEEDGVVPRRRSGRARRADVEPQPESEHKQEYDEIDVQH